MISNSQLVNNSHKNDTEVTFNNIQKRKIKEKFMQIALENLDFTNDPYYIRGNDNNVFL